MRINPGPANNLCLFIDYRNVVFDFELKKKKKKKIEIVNWFWFLVCVAAVDGSQLPVTVSRRALVMYHPTTPNGR